MPNISNNFMDDGFQNLLTCRAQHCNNLGDCVIRNGLKVCKCMLGYRGDACQETVNDGLAVPLTLGVLGFVIGFIILAFALAFVQQKRRERLWEKTNEKREALKRNGNFSHTKIVKTVGDPSHLESRANYALLDSLGLKSQFLDDGANA